MNSYACSLDYLYVNVCLLVFCQLNFFLFYETKCEGKIKT